jgi:hypothetical protein
MPVKGRITKEGGIRRTMCVCSRKNAYAACLRTDSSHNQTQLQSAARAGTMHHRHESCRARTFRSDLKFHYNIRYQCLRPMSAWTMVGRSQG